MKRAVVLLASILPCLFSFGCGKVFYGKTQSVIVRTTPPGATASLSSERTTTPGTVTVLRNQPGGWVVLRAELAGYQAGCQLVAARRKVAFIVLDSFLLAIPLLVDVSTVGFGSLRKLPDEVDLTLQPLRSGEVPISLLSDQEIIRARQKWRVDLCDPSELRNASAARTGCVGRDAVIEDVTVGLNSVSWSVHCHGRQFLCTGGQKLSDVTCTESIR